MRQIMSMDFFKASMLIARFSVFLKLHSTGRNALFHKIKIWMLVSYVLLRDVLIRGVSLLSSSFQYKILQFKNINLALLLIYSLYFISALSDLKIAFNNIS